MLLLGVLFWSLWAASRPPAGLETVLRGCCAVVWYGMMGKRERKGFFIGGEFVELLGRGLGVLGYAKEMT
jgi:hypothetical protein